MDVLQHNRDMMSLEKVKLEAQVAMLTKAGGACCVRASRSNKAANRSLNPPVLTARACVLSLQWRCSTRSSR